MTIINIISYLSQKIQTRGIVNLFKTISRVYQNQGLKGIVSALRVSIRSNKVSTEISDITPDSAKPSVYFTEYKNNHLQGDEFKTKLICFYLPQFHPFKENNEFWGEGFTEWTNVTKAMPIYEGHHQPRFPRDLGYYDLRLKETIQKQASIAKNYGIYGFCVHYYWFSGKKVMDTPLNIIFENKDIDINYSLCWANENWTRRWDGNDQDVLLAQEHHDDDTIKFIKDIIPYLKDPRYIRINDCPLLVVYRAELFKDPFKTTTIWREYVKSQGIKDLHLVMTHSFQENIPSIFGFDSAVDFAPNTFPMSEISSKMNNLSSKFIGKIFDYEDAINHSLSKEKKFPFYKSLCLQWDNSARKGIRGTILENCTPDKFAFWLHSLIKQKPLNDIIFINAWNEWAEGTYLEPDRKNGFSYLDKCFQTLNQSSSSNQINAPTHRRAIYFHVHYFDCLEPHLNRLKTFASDHDFIFSLSPVITPYEKNLIQQSFTNCSIYHFKNKGRDILPFLQLLEDNVFDSYEHVLKLHTKKSPHLPSNQGKQWAEKLITGLLVKNLSFQDTTIIATKESLVDLNDYIGTNNFYIRKHLKHKHHKFISGTMFWFKPISLKTKIIPFINKDLFEEEPLTIDGHYAHSVERLIGILVDDFHVIETKE